MDISTELLGWCYSSGVDPWPGTYQALTMIPRNTKAVCLLSASKVHGFKKISVLELSIKIPTVRWKDSIGPPRKLSL